MAYKARIDITDRNRVQLDTRHIHENEPLEALRQQSEIYKEAKNRYGDECYIFTNWLDGNAPSSHIPGSNADKGRKPHRLFPEERGTPEEQHQYLQGLKRLRGHATSRA